MAVYDDVDDDVLRCYHEMTLANLIYYAMKEAACSEQSSRMSAMDGASKNASKWVLAMVECVSVCGWECANVWVCEYVLWSVWCQCVGCVSVHASVNV